MKPSRSKDRPVWVRDLESRVITIWEDARKNGHTHEALLEARKARIFDSPHWRQLTQGERARIIAFWNACNDMAYRRDLVWRLGPKDAPLPETLHGMHDWTEGSPLPELSRISGALFGGHFWRGTENPFSGYTCINANRL